MRCIAATLALVVVGCLSANGTFDPRALGDRHAALAAHPEHRLADAAPYFAAAPDGLALFLCRFTTSEAIAVLLPEGATEAERQVLQQALGAWAGAGLGVTFDVVTRAVPPPERRIEIDFVETQNRGSQDPGGDTIADCAVPEMVVPVASPAAGPIRAELAYASIHLRRSRRDALGQKFDLTPSELLGASVHELGHALGFPGHVRRADAVMAARGQIDTARRWGRWLEEGRALVSPTLAALYAVPSGARVGALPLAPERLQPLRELVAVARDGGLLGPFVRVGQRSARLLWRTGLGRSAVLGIADWKLALREPTHFELRPNVLAAEITRGPERR